jgi:hypothetical protein
MADWSTYKTTPDPARISASQGVEAMRRMNVLRKVILPLIFENYNMEKRVVSSQSSVP